MKSFRKISRLIFNGEWSFIVSGTEYIRKDLKIGARLNILIHRGLNLFRLPYCFGTPYTLTVEPASICNLKCPACPAGINIVKRSPSLLTLEDFKRTIDMIGDYLVHILLWNWGEPFINKDVFEMIEYASRKGILVVTSSNGHFFDNDENVEKLFSSGLANLVISVDGTTQEVYERYRVGGNLEKVLAGVKRVTAAKKKLGAKWPDTNLRFMINAYNEEQLPEFKELAREVGTDSCTFRLLDTCLAKQPEKCTDLVPKNEDFVFQRQITEYDSKCMLFWYMPVLYSNGKIGMCKMDALGEAEIMHISEASSFNQIWNNPAARQHRRYIKKDPTYSFCMNCFCREPDFDNVNMSIYYDDDGNQQVKVLSNKNKNKN